MKNIFLLFIAALLISCTKTPSEKHDEDFNLSEETSLESTLSFPDSLFIENNIEEFINRDATALVNSGGKKINKVNSDLLNSLKKCFSRQILEGYYYTKLDINSKLYSVVMIVSDMTSSYFIFTSLDSEYNVISCLRLTNDQCDLINTETGSEEVWCEIKKSNLINANVLRTVEINSKEILDDNVKVVDSLTNEYKLDEKGVLNLIRKDSVRYTSSTLEQ
jgi:hypothetical protein